METKSIEQLDKLRYNLLKWVTIGWAIWFGTFVLKNFTESKFLIGLTTWVGLLGWVIFIINLIKHQKLRRELKWDSKMNNALNDELHQFNVHKSFMIGYSITIATTAVFYGISKFMDISGVLATSVILYIGVLSTLIAMLIYNRD